MVFCLENEMPHRLLGSAMVHFHASEVQQLLHNKFVVILGDSIQRAVYKDLVLLLQKDTLLTASQLKAKGELSFEQDQLVAGGQLGELHNGTQYREVRQFCSGSGHHLVRFYFLTRVYSEYLEDILEELSYGPAPDLVIINSCLWDLSRYGRCSMESYRENLERVFVRMDQVLPDSCLLVWNLAMPLGERVTGGFLLPEISTSISGMLSVTVIEMVPIGTSMHTATSRTYFWPTWPMPGVWSCPNMTGCQDTPFFQGQPFPPYEFKYNAMEDFSMPGCGPGMNFVPGPLPPSVSGPVSHGQHRGPVVHRGKPRCVLNNPYHVPRIGGPCRHRLRHSDRLIHTYKQDRRGHAHSGTWPG